MSSFFSFTSDFIIAPMLLVILLSVGIYMCVKLRFFHLTKVPMIVNNMLSSKGNMTRRSPLKEVSVALAGTLGVGNLMGVAAAISLGGAGSIFWMWVGAFISMILKYAEIVLAVKFRIVKNGSLLGGAMYYIRTPFFRTLFALLCIITSFTLGNIMQTRAVSECFEYVFDVPPIVCGIILSIVVFLVIINGHKGVSGFTSIIIPLACFVYIAISMFVILTNSYMLPDILSEIISSAFTLPAASGGLIGNLIIMLLPVRYGISRGLITNEAGCGTAPIAHAAADTDHPAAQGFWGLFEVFADTILLCSLSAFVLLIARPDFSTGGDMENVLTAFRTYCGSISDYILSISVLFFAVAGIVGWFYYGLVGLEFLSDGKRHARLLKKLYALTYSFCVIFGSVCMSELMWDLTDISIGLMAIINTPCIFSYRELIVAQTRDFFSRNSIT